MRKVSAVIISLLCALFIISCNGDSPSEPAERSYSVAVPQFLEGNNNAMKTIDGSSLTLDQQTLFTLYEFFPPITDFSTESLTVGSKVYTTILGEDLSLTMSLDSDENYVFEGSNNSDYLKVVINKDNSSFSFTHAISAWTGSFYVMPVITGQGEILDSGFEGFVDIFILNSGTCQKSKALIKKDGTNYGFISYSGYTGTITPPSESFDVMAYQQYVDEADTFATSMLNPYMVFLYDGTTISQPAISSFNDGFTQIANSGLSSWTPQDPSQTSDVSIVGIWNFTRNGKDAYMQLNADGTGIIHYYQYYGAGAGGLNRYVNVLISSWSYNPASASFRIATGNRFNPENLLQVSYTVTTLDANTLEMTADGAVKHEVPTSCTR